MITIYYVLFYLCVSWILINARLIKTNKYVKTAGLLIIGLFFTINLGENGTDLPYYLQFFEYTTLENPFFDGQILEPTLGIIVVAIKSLTGKTNGDQILWIYRILVYTVLPASIYLKVKARNKEQGQNAAIGIMLLFTFPYTLLGAVNIISNGLSFQLFYMWLLIEASKNINRKSIEESHSNTKKEKRNQRITGAVLLLLAIGTHGIGLILGLLYFASWSGLKICNKLKPLKTIIKFNNKLKARSYTILALISSILLALLTERILTSKLPDSTSLILAIATLLLGLLTNKEIHKYMHKARLENGDPVKILATQDIQNYLNQIRIFLAVLCIFQLIIAALGGGDAAERITFSTIGLQSLYLILIGYQGKRYKASKQVRPDQTAFIQSNCLRLAFIAPIFINLGLSLLMLSREAFRVNVLM